MGRRAKPGDVLELQADGRFGYFQYLGKHAFYGAAILVIPRFYDNRVAVEEGMFSDAYITFYPVATALNLGLVKIVGSFAPRSVPVRLRRAGGRSGKNVLNWFIDDGSQEMLKVELSEEDLKLPIAASWNHEYLVQMIGRRWTPMEDADDDKASPPVKEVSLGRERSIVHYLYAPTKKAAERVASELRSRGFVAEERLSADGDNYLILAKQQADPSGGAIEVAQNLMKTLIEAVGGEYDGHEVELH